MLLIRIVLAAAVGVAFAGAPANARQPGTGPGTGPDVLVLLSDDQQWNAVSALGNDHIHTPNLDRLVAEGFVFSQAYVMGSWHGAVCQPSRAMLMTGRTLWRVAPDLAGHRLWPQMMAEAGYVTFGCGKWHNGPESYAAGFRRGGHVFFGGMGDHHALPVHEFDAGGRYPREARRPAARFSSELFADDAVEFLRGHDGASPFFAYVSFTAPHDPRTAPEPFASRYDPEQLPLPANFLPEHPFDNGELTVRDEKLAPHPRTPAVIREHLAAYYAMISHLDAQVGRILDALDETGRSRDTLVVFASDNGLAVGQHGLLGKQSLYEHSLRVPLILRGPGVPAGGRSEALCYLLDVLPTVLELCGVPVPAGVEGRSLAPVMRGEREGVRETLFGAYRNLQRMVRDERYKLIRYRVGGAHTTQLFDLRDDPWEMHDLAAGPEHAATRRRLEEALAAWQRRVDDPDPAWSPAPD